MVTWKSKSCPRCGGDMFIENDMDGWYEQCLQCSHRVELKKLAEPKEPVLNTGRRRSKKRVRS
jgi:ribosomal protein S27AE